MHQGHVQRAFITVQHLVKPVIEPPVEPLPPSELSSVLPSLRAGGFALFFIAFMGFMSLVSLDQIGAKQGHHRHGHEVGGK